MSGEATHEAHRARALASQSPVLLRDEGRAREPVRRHDALDDLEEHGERVEDTTLDSVYKV